MSTMTKVETSAQNKCLSRGPANRLQLLLHAHVKIYPNQKCFAIVFVSLFLRQYKVCFSLLFGKDK